MTVQINAIYDRQSLLRWLRMFFRASLILLVLLPVMALAQGEMPAKGQADFTKVLEDTDNQLDVATPKFNLPSGGTIESKVKNLPPELKAALYEQELAKFKREAWSYKYEEKVYEWQYVTSKVVFVMVILLVIAGMFFSWLQFRQSLHTPKKIRIVERKPKPVEVIASEIVPAPTGGTSVQGKEGESLVKVKENESADEAQQATPSHSEDSEKDTYEIEASATGIKIHTSMFGVAILAFSLIFFYLYLQFIYPVK